MSIQKLERSVSRSIQGQIAHSVRKAVFLTKLILGEVGIIQRNEVWMDILALEALLNQAKNQSWIELLDIL